MLKPGGMAPGDGTTLGVAKEQGRGPLSLMWMPLVS